MATLDTEDLPLLDEHETVVAADAATTWAAVTAVVDATFSHRRWAPYARLVGADPAASGGPRPLAEGSTVLGFRVTSAVPNHELRLEGRHRFSRYALVFLVRADGGRSTAVTARSLATFPGIHGRLYRMLVVGSGVHVASVRGILDRMRRRAEAAT